MIQDVLNDIAERCVVNQNGIRRLDEDKFIEEILSNQFINNRLDELKIRSARNLMSDDKYMYLRNVCEEYDIGLMSSWVDEKIEELSKFGTRQMKVKQYYTERGVKEEYSDDLKDSYMIMKPVSVLMNNSNEVVRTMLCKSDDNKFMLLQRRDRLSDTQYNLMKIEPEELMNILSFKRELKTDPRIKDVYDLNFEEHVKLANYINDKSNNIIITTKKAIHPYQRDLLNDDELIQNIGVISNVMLNDVSEKKRKNNNVIEHSKNISAFKGNDDDLIIHNQYCINENSKNINLKNRKQNEMNPQEMYKTFGDMM
jgi:hypothetical protein